MTTKINYNNAINFFTRNKHSDYPEVVFSSILSNLLDPELSFVFKNELINFIYEKYFGPNTYKVGKLESEASLFKAGNIDILYTTDDSVLGIEVKIWDRSARNVDENGERQLIRYAQEISKIKSRWKLLFIVPTNSSKICLDEFKVATSLYPDNIFMLPWNLDETEDLPLNVSTESILSILERFADRVCPDNISRWIYDSLIEVIPSLIEETPDPKKFPSLNDLKEIKDLWPLFEKLFMRYKVSPNPIHTTIGIPIKHGTIKSKVHGNCLFRIRTTKSYYLKEEGKVSNLPSEFVEIEIWKDVFNQVSNELHLLTDKHNLELTEDVHLSSKKEKVILLSLPVSLNFELFITEFDNLMRRAIVNLEQGIN